MPTIPHQKLNQMARQFAPGLVDKLIAAGTFQGDELTVPAECLREICAAFPPLPDPERWPLCIRLIAKHAEPEDSGVGDTLHRLIGPVLGEGFNQAVQTLLGRPCHCPRRRAQLNASFPYPKPAAGH